jgi:hypothetical protein
MVRKRKRTASHNTSVLGTPHPLDKVARPTLTPERTQKLDEAESSSSATRRLLKSLEAIDNVQVLLQVAPRIHPDTYVQNAVRADPFAFVYTDSRLYVRPGRNFQPIVKKTPANPWQLNARQGATTRKFISIPAMPCSEDSALAICTKLVDALHRWPDMDQISSSGRPIVDRSRALCEATHVVVCPVIPILLSAPTFQANGSASYADCRLKLSIIDPNSLQPKITYKHSRLTSSWTSFQMSIT